MASTLRELAQHCGIQGASIYHHFSSKQEILHEIMDYTMTTLIERLKETIDGAGDPLEKLDRAIRFHIRYHIKNPHITHVTDNELRNLKAEYLEYILRKRDEYEGLLHRLLSEGIAAGLIKVDNMPLARMAILQMCTGVTIWFRQNGPLTVDQVAEAYIQFIRWGVLGKVTESDTLKKMP
jgi:TetR/AcrR family transcriptional regulator, cholesterol catabolism regulator